MSEGATLSGRNPKQRGQQRGKQRASIGASRGGYRVLEFAREALSVGAVYTQRATLRDTDREMVGLGV